PTNISVSNSCLEAFSALKKRKLKYIIYKLNDSSDEIVVDKTSSDTNYDTFIKDLPETECRWAVYNLEYEEGERMGNAILLIVWSPEVISTRNKMLCASSAGVVRNALGGIDATVRAFYIDELDYGIVLDAARSMN
ncbi:cofilin, partial [Linderina macrospora]